MRESSQRIRQVDLPIIPTIAAMVREHPGTISLGQGVVNYGPPAAAIEAIGRMAADPANHKYQSVHGIAPLLAAIDRKLALENGIDRDAAAGEHACVTVTAGSNSAFLTAALAVSEPGDSFILPLPYYFNHEMAIRMIGCTPICVMTDAQWQLDLPAIEAAITDRTRAIVTVSPNNPTGAVYREEDLRAVNRLCAERGLYHFSDEAYESFVHDGARHFSPASIPGSQPHTLSFYSFSKGWGMASWRVGYVLYPSHLREAIEKVQDTNLICAPVPSQHVACAALELGPGAVRAHRDALSRTREAVYGELAALGSLARFPVTRGAFYVMVELPGVEDPLEFSRAMVRDHGVATIPGFAFGLTDVRRSNWQRLSYGALDEATVQQGVHRFVQAARQWYRR